MKKPKRKNRKSGAAVRSSELVRALAKELHAAGLEEVRRVEGYSDGSGWDTTSQRTKNGMIGIAKYVKDWKRPNNRICDP